MTGPTNRAEESALWRRWRAAVVNAAGEPAPAPDALLLAAYAEHRLDEAAAEAVEAWLAGHPDAMADIAAARDSNTERPLAPASEAALARAQALVPALDPTVVPFQRPARHVPAWRVALARVSVAASLLIVSGVGFALGTDAYTSVLSGEPSAPALSQELFDPPTGIFSSFGEESNT